VHKLAIVASHPIQYQAAWFRALAARVDLTVFFCHRQTREGHAEAGYGLAFEWDVPLVDGYRAEWLQNVSRHPGVFRFDGCDTPEVGERLRRGGFDACVVSGWYLKSYLQAIFACWRSGIPVLLRGDSQLTTPRSSLRTATKYLPYRLLLTGVAGPLYVGSANRRYLVHYGVRPERLFFVPHSIDDRWFSDQAAAARRTGETVRIRRELGVSDDATMMLFVGRLVEQKRPLDFVDAIARTSRDRKTVGVIAGSGPLGAAVEGLVRDTGAPVRTIGFRNQSALPALYAAADVFVLPSDARETWGLVVNEAMACGTPAAVSDAVGCAGDLIRPYTGEVFPAGDVGALAQAMAHIVALRRSTAETVRSELARMAEMFSAVAAAEATAAAIEAVTTHRDDPSLIGRATAWM
jgi:glycosyltransferase involved in cell wall biosynthesis